METVPHTYEKKGSGLGLHSAKKALEEWNGELSIDSQVGHGTTVKMNIPSSPAPAWFVSELRIPVGAPIVILDDDPSIHQIWRRKLDSLRSADGPAQLQAHHFTSVADLRAWYQREKPRQAIYLLDCELRGEEATGLELAQELGIEAQSILVSSHFGEKAFLEKTHAARIRLIPKRLAGFVPVKLVAEELVPDLVLIDDETNTHEMWQRVADKRGKRLRAFLDPEKALRELFDLDRSVPIYVDHRLAGGVLGTTIAQRLHEVGFRKIYLATGESRSRLPDLPFFEWHSGQDLSAAECRIRLEGGAP